MSIYKKPKVDLLDIVLSPPTAVKPSKITFDLYVKTPHVDGLKSNRCQPGDGVNQISFQAESAAHSSDWTGVKLNSTLPNVMFK